MRDEQSAPKRPGRPRARERHASASVWLGAHEHDRLVQLAAKTDLSVSAVLRRLIVLSLNERDRQS